MTLPDFIIWLSGFGVGAAVTVFCVHFLAGCLT
jgi:hypothetical protein